MTSILKADTIQDTDGNNIINENSNTITIGASGDTTNIIGTLQNNGAAVGGTNTPTFLAYLSSNQSISASTETKVQFNTEVFDTAGNYDNSSNYRFTPTTAGKYIVYALIDHSWTGDWGSQRHLRIKKNGSNIARNDHFDRTTANATYGSVFVSASCSMNGSSDYLEAFAYSDATGPVINGGLDRTYFGAYKIIE